MTKCFGEFPVSRRAVLTGLLASSIKASSSRLGAADELQGIYVPDAVDRAIDRGIDSLLSHQRDDGAITDRGHATAMTALSIMALASIGVVPDSVSPRGRALNRAIEFVLMPRNQANGYFGERDGSRMYGHGIVTLMLTEMLGMGASVEQNSRIHESLVAALKVILKSQSVRKPPRLQGGWRYTPSARDSDLSVSVWQVMALRSAKNDGLDVPAEAIESAVEYLRNSYTSPMNADGLPRDRVGGFAYTPGTRHPSFTMTAAGLLALQTCGQYDSPLVAGAAEWLLEHPPRSQDRFFYYGMYYYAQGMHQVGGKAAEEAKRLTSEELLNFQSNSGHWNGQHGEERNIGLVYCTTLAILSLSVRYHYLPIYQR
ncbi:prenyltransferase/squalene oxidase repeat-containing protein [Neorhodopirellula lusitana]|uniref:prenyltransferase/squalene oxidase repeat-containing protein n=1 Tax=Neorhodopirellula lusitana TaxID=445327 RepID=UPI00384BB17C